MDDDNSDVRNDKKELRETPEFIWETSAFRGVVLLVGAPIVFLFSFVFDMPETGLIVASTAFITAMIGGTFWSSRKKYYFWIFITLMALAQLPIVLLIPWEKTHLLGVSLLPLGLIDYFVMYGVFKQIKKHFDSNGGNADLF